MGKINISEERFEKIVRYGSMLVFGVLALGLLSSRRIDISAVEDCASEANYSDAVGAILDSSMFDSDKNAAIGLLKRGGDSEYYKSVISVINSSIVSRNKIRTIEKLSEK